MNYWIWLARSYADAWKCLFHVLLIGLCLWFSLGFTVLALRHPWMTNTQLRLQWRAALTFQRVRAIDVYREYGDDAFSPPRSPPE